MVNFGPVTAEIVWPV